MRRTQRAAPWWVACRSRAGLLVLGLAATLLQVYVLLCYWQSRDARLPDGASQQSIIGSGLQQRVSPLSGSLTCAAWESFLPPQAVPASSEASTVADAGSGSGSAQRVCDVASGEASEGRWVFDSERMYPYYGSGQEARCDVPTSEDSELASRSLPSDAQLSLAFHPDAHHPNNSQLLSELQYILDAAPDSPDKSSREAGGRTAEGEEATEEARREQWLQLMFRRLALNSSAEMVRPAVKYVWRPSTCQLPQFDAASFCRSVDGRDVFFIGDSLTAQQYKALRMAAVYQLWQATKGYADYPFRNAEGHFSLGSVSSLQFRPDVPSINGVCQRLIGPDWRGNVTYLRTNFLVASVPIYGDLLFDPNAKCEYKECVPDWQRHITDRSVLVLNTGLHFVDDEFEALRVLRTTIVYLRDTFPGSVLVWRSTSPPHNSCHHWAYSGRPLSELEYRVMTSSRLHSSKAEWGHARIERRNQLVREMLAWAFEQQPHRVLYLDIWPMTKLRTDGHVPFECVHYCSPGPIDTWTAMTALAVAQTLSHPSNS